MSPELIAILAVGVTLAGVLLSGQRALRSEMRDRFAAVENQITDLRQSTEARFAAIEQHLSAFEQRIAALEQRVAKLEGLLEGLREAIVARAAQNVTQ